MENKRKNDDFSDLSDFNQKYNHYVNDNSAESNKDVTPSVNTDDEYEDIISYSSDNERSYLHDGIVSDDSDINHSEAVTNTKTKNSFTDFFSRNKYKNTKIIAICLVIAIILTFAFFIVYFYFISKDMVSGDNGIDTNDNPIEDSDYIDDTEMDFHAMGDVDANSLNDFLYKWANNGGEKMYNKNVINVLLCGVDSKSGEASSGRSDSMILISVNKKTETITMCSLLRDSWTYIKVPKSDGTTYDYYFKMNAAYNNGGPATLLETIENNLKIEIDQYIAVDFNSFPKLIDALGGVTVDVQNYEASYIRRTSSHTDFPSGVSKLDGDEALVYSRIRYSDGDSDVSRTRRQRSVIKALIESAKTATNGQLVNAFKQVSGYLRTGYTQTEVLSLIASAYSHNWMSFTMNELMLPNEDYVDRLSTYIGSQSAWVVDYALCAQKLQKALYGETNIVLSANRTSALDLVTNKRTTTSSSGSGSSYSNDDDDDDDYVTSTRRTSSSYYDDDNETTKSTTSSSSRTTTTRSSEQVVTTDNNDEENNGENQ